MITTSDSIKKISPALLAFQAQVQGVGKSSTNPHFKNKYANLETVVDTARPALQSAGIVFMQSGGAIVDGVMAMTTRLIHAESGEWIEGTMDIALGKRDPQGVGSAQTYAQRYHLMAMLGLPPVDDDGEGAIDRNNERHVPADPEMPRLDQTIAAINTSPNMDALQKTFGAAWRHFTDTANRNKLTPAYEARKKALSGTSAPNFDNLQPADGLQQ